MKLQRVMSEAGVEYIVQWCMARSHTDKIDFINGVVMIMEDECKSWHVMRMVHGFEVE